MHKSYKKWLDDGCPKLYCECLCHGEIIIKNYCKWYGIPKYINGHYCRVYDIPESYQKWLDNGKPKVFCRCPCHKEIIISWRHKYEGIPQYINGHYWTNKKFSIEHKQKLSNNNVGMLGKHQSEETKQKLHEKKINIPFSEKHKQKLRESSPHICGENHWSWKGGISKLPYCEKWTEELREEIRERDSRICQECNKTEEENNRKLSVHHIHYDKENCYPDLIALCSCCSSIANGNRDYWEEYYMEKLKERNLLNYFGDKI